jgi:hypothetical protein
MKISRLTIVRLANPRRAFIAAAILHLLLTLSIFSVGRIGLFPSQFDRDGLGEFAHDSKEFRTKAIALADTLRSGDIGSWAKSQITFHVKAYSLDLVLMRPLLGVNILAVEPLNLVYYLTILVLTFSLAQLVAGQRAAWPAVVIVGLWPSLLLHTTQLVRDPLLITAILTLVLVVTGLLTRTHNWRSAAFTSMMGTGACFVIWLCRRDIWLVITIVVGLSAVLLMVRILRERKLIVWNLAILMALCVLVIVIPRKGRVTQPGIVVPGAAVIVPRYQDGSIWSQIAVARDKFISEGRLQSGSIIDEDVSFSSRTDVLKYIPRALEIGFLAPFPTMWFTAGRNVGLSGRLLAGIETLTTYMIEFMAGLFAWRNKHRLSVWLLTLTVGTGLLALGMVVVNVGTLYRIRYPFWILMTIMAASTLADWIFGQPDLRVSSRPAPDSLSNVRT